ncbi:selenoprotein [Halobacteriales archaeon QS_1_68_17]|nr:MAG: selenoprotein [Halobacteriales archaeon QS_1_68_17]
MTEVEIEYCVPCGFLDRAEDVQHAICSTFGERVDRVALVSGDKGVFKVRADGDLVFDKDEHEFDVRAIVDEVRAYV